MSGLRNLNSSSWCAVLWIAVVLLSGGSVAAQTGTSSRSLYAKQGQFAARTTNYSPAWKVHPKVRPQQGGGQGHPVRQARYQGEVLEPPFTDEEPTGPPIEEYDPGIPTETEAEPIETPPVRQAPVERPTEAPIIRQAPASRAPSQPTPAARPNGGQRPTRAPAPPEVVGTPRGRAMEEIRAPHGVPRPQPDFDYEMTDEYGHPIEEYGGEYVEDEYGGYVDEYGGEYGSSCPDCGQGVDYCQCPPNVCDDTWPCWHARRQWRNFRLFGGGWDIGCPWNWWDELTLFGGAHSFKGPLDQGRNGNFGIQEGINWGGPLWHCKGIGFQIGAQGVQSNFAGYDVNGVTDDSRSQVFGTAGVFARAPNCHGWQLGVTFDWLRDNYYVDVSLDQVRAELSYVTFCGTELGAWIASSSKTDVDESTGVTYEATDMYALFLRHNTAIGGEGRIWGGATGPGDGLLGADFRVPLTSRWALAGAVNYIIPQDGAGPVGLVEESWALTLNFVWHPFRARNGSTGNSQYTPLMSVADNTMFMTRTATDE